MTYQRLSDFHQCSRFANLHIVVAMLRYYELIMRDHAHSYALTVGLLARHSGFNILGMR